ncbi:MAG: LacI family DNA-binding transcriptional regulator [Oscillospiraceae bacterium]|nr:LacI family DNA-binding transcriptional regulator [Oscillospiraceae bacterium]
MKRTTIQDIADALGLSRNTVSKAINKSDGLADATREKILRKAVEMGYMQFACAASPPESTTLQPVPVGTHDGHGAAGEIAVFTANLSLLSNHFTIPMLDRFKREISQLGYILRVYKVEREDLARHTLPVTFATERVKAILCVEMFDWSYDEMICRLGLPVLFVDGPNKRSGNSLPADQLYMDSVTGITRIVNEMLRKGKRKIGFIGDYEHCQSFFERYAAFRSTMTLAGVPVDETFCIKSNSIDMEDSLAALPEMPEMFICANDSIAVDTMQSLRKLGKSVPRDILLCGFDNAPESRIMTPALTTIHIHTQIMAYTAIHLLMTRMSEPTLDYRTVHTATELIYRESTEC